MAEVVLFHHAQGLTPGVVAFADELRQAGHTVHTPDLLDGRTFGSIDEGMRYAEEIGFPDEVIGRGVRAVEGLPAELVYAGFSLGVLPHYFADSSLPSYDPEATALLVRRVLDFLRTQ
jgi:dienelactone hydrolase